MPAIARMARSYKRRSGMESVQDWAHRGRRTLGRSGLRPGSASTGTAYRWRNRSPGVNPNNPLNEAI